MIDVLPAMPRAWIEWARNEGSDVLRRAVRDGYPFKALLRRELIARCVPPVAPLERPEIDFKQKVNWGELREPNAQSFRYLDMIDLEQRTGNRVLPEGTTVTVGKLVRVDWLDGSGDEVRAAGVEVVIEHAASYARIRAGYVWGRNDRPSEGGNK